MKYRQSTHDAPIRKPVIPKDKPGENLPQSRIAVIDEKGNRHGHISRATGTEATAKRLGVHNAKLVQRDGSPVWQGESGAFNQRRAAIKLQQQRIIAKGSVTKSPTKPALARRPERGG